MAYRNRISLVGQKPHGIRIDGLIPWGSITGQQATIPKYVFTLEEACCSHHPYVFCKTNPSSKTSWKNYITMGTSMSGGTTGVSAFK